MQRHNQEQNSNYLCCTGCLAKWSRISLASYLELALATALLHSAQLLAPSKWAGNWKVTLLTSMRMSLVHGLQVYPGSWWPGHPLMVNKAVDGDLTSRPWYGLGIVSSLDSASPSASMICRCSDFASADDWHHTVRLYVQFGNEHGWLLAYVLCAQVCYMWVCMYMCIECIKRLYTGL
jgi:hypothetical protein